jgi:hypothetical protein
MNKALNKISDVKNAIENLAENYHCKFDYLNEKAQQGERAQAMAEECSELERLVETLDEAIAIGDSLVALRSAEAG